MTEIHVSIVIPTWRRAACLETCLRATLGQVAKPDEVIVVGREEDTEALDIVARFKEFPFIRWVCVTPPGHIDPVIKGLGESRGELVAFLDDDAEPEREWLAAMLPHFEDPGVACVGGRVVTPGFTGEVPSDAGQIRWYGKHVGNVGALEVIAPVEVQAVMECSWMWRTDVMRHLDFDRVFFEDDASMYGLDLCLQAKGLGYHVVYEPRARVVHHVAPRDPLLDRHDRRARTVAYSRNYTLIALKHFNRWRLLAFLAWWWLVGDRGSYGLCLGALDSTRKGREVVPLIGAAFKGKCEGVLLWRRR